MERQAGVNGLLGSGCFQDHPADRAEIDLSNPVQSLLLQLIDQCARLEAPSAGSLFQIEDANFAGSAEDGRLLDVTVDRYRCVVYRLKEEDSARGLALSPREQEIARMVARGYPTKTIAMVLDISSWTVNTYLRRIFAKLGVSSRAAMVARLLERGALEKVISLRPDLLRTE